MLVLLGKYAAVSPPFRVYPALPSDPAPVSLLPEAMIQRRLAAHAAAQQALSREAVLPQPAVAASPAPCLGDAHVPAAADSLPPQSQGAPAASSAPPTTESPAPPLFLHDFGSLLQAGAIPPPPPDLSSLLDPEYADSLGHGSQTSDAQFLPSAEAQSLVATVSSVPFPASAAPQSAALVSIPGAASAAFPAAPSLGVVTAPPAPLHQRKRANRVAVRTQQLSCPPNPGSAGFFSALGPPPQVAADSAPKPGKVRRVQGASAGEKVPPGVLRSTLDTVASLRLCDWLPGHGGAAGGEGSGSGTSAPHAAGAESPGGVDLWAGLPVLFPEVRQYLDRGGPVRQEVIDSQRAHIAATLNTMVRGLGGAHQPYGHA